MTDELQERADEIRRGDLAEEENRRICRELAGLEPLDAVACAVEGREG